MGEVLGIDHIAITTPDLTALVGFYERVFGARTSFAYPPEGKAVVLQINFGGAMFSVHQADHGLGLVAGKPAAGAIDLCLRWSDPIETAVALLNKHGIVIVEGPVQRMSATGVPGMSIYFRDPDENLIEIMGTTV